uniref:Uncharacterized protein n=1 Tax=Strigamia maritima TaxID=126957 RepID=T1JLC0_STRMM
MDFETHCNSRCSVVLSTSAYDQSPYSNKCPDLAIATNDLLVYSWVPCNWQNKTSNSLTSCSQFSEGSNNPSFEEISFSHEGALDGQKCDIFFPNELSTSLHLKAMYPDIYSKPSCSDCSISDECKFGSDVLEFEYSCSSCRMSSNSSIEVDCAELLSISSVSSVSSVCGIALERIEDDRNGSLMPSSRK